MNPWIYLVIGGIFETIWAITLKESNGFSDPFWDIVTCVFVLSSIYLLNVGLEKGLPTGLGYAVWAGMGAIGSFIVGIVAYGDALTAIRCLLAALIIIGAMGIELKAGTANDPIEVE